MSSLAGQDPGGSARQNLQGVDLSIGQLKAFGMDLNQAVVRLARSGPAWDLRLDSKEVIGNARIPDAKGAPLTMRLHRCACRPPIRRRPRRRTARTRWPRRSAQRAGAGPDHRQAVPGRRPVRQCNPETAPVPRGIALSDVDLDLKGLHIDGSGGWEGEPGSTSAGTRAPGRQEPGGCAQGLGLRAHRDQPRLPHGRGWPLAGFACRVSLNRFSGSLDAALRTGQFVEVEGSAQALRVFGLLNFNSIGRRLRLDFSDLFSKGLAYDRVKGLLVASKGCT
jgi:uncharacterized protein YhdP